MAKDASTILLANLGSIIGQSLLYGCFVTVFVVSLYVLIVVRPSSRLESRARPQRQPPIQLVLLATSAVMFSLITAHWIVNVVRAFDGFVKSRNDTLAYYENPTEILNLTQAAIYFIEVLLADAILTYRAFIVWNRKVWVFGFPVICWLAAAASSFFLIYNLSKGATGPVDGKEAGYQHNVNLWTTPTFVLSVCINIYCSSMILIKIWSIQRHLKPLIDEKPSLWRSVHTSMIVDSAAVYVAMSIVTMAAFIAQSDLSWVLMNFTGPVIGITFCLIILRAGNATQEARLPPSNHDRERGTFRLDFPHRGPFLDIAANPENAAKRDSLPFDSLKTTSQTRTFVDS